MPVPKSVTTAKLPKNIKVEKILAQWEAPSRPYKKRNREYYTTVASIVFLLAVILLLLKEFLLVGVIITFAFVSYALSSVQPGNTNHQITTKGVRTEDRLFKWETLTNFWLQEKWGQEIMIIMTKLNLPSHIMMIIEPQKRDKIIKSVGQMIPLEKPEDSFVDRASTWLQKKVPLENT